METWHYQQAIKDCKPFIFKNYGHCGQTGNLAMMMFEAGLIEYDTWQYITELSHEKDRLNHLLNVILDPSYINIKTAFDFLVEQFNRELYANISEKLTVTLEKVKTYEKPLETPILERLDRLHDNLSDLTPNQLRVLVKKIRVQIVAEGFEKDVANKAATKRDCAKEDSIRKDEAVGVTHTDTTREDRLSNINMRDSEGKTTLMWAVERGDIAEMSDLFDAPNLDLTVYDYGGLTFEYHVFGDSILKHMYIDEVDELQYYPLKPNLYVKLKDDKSKLDWDVIMKVIEFLVAKEKVDKAKLLQSCIIFGNERVIEMVLKSVLKTVVITEDMKDFILYITQTINPVVVKFLQDFEISLNTSNVDAIMYSVIRYNCPDTSLVLLDNLALTSIKVDNAWKTVLCLQSIKPAVLTHIVKHSKFNLNERDQKDNATVFMTLCYFGSYEVISKLLEQTAMKIDFKARDKSGHNCFMRALQRNTEDVSLLLLQNPKIAVIIKSILNTVDKSGETLLIEAIKRGHVRSASLIIDHGAKVNKKGKDDKTALMMASRLGQVSIVSKLLSIASIDVNATDSNTQTALHEASVYGQDRIVNLLIDHASININAEDNLGRTALHCACSSGHDKVVTHLIMHDGIKINTKNHFGETALHAAIQHKYDVLNGGSTGTCIRHRSVRHRTVDINAQRSDKITPLHLASSWGNTAVVTVLISHSDIDVNVGDITGNTPLHKASSLAHEVVVSQLINHAAIDVNAKNKNGNTALHSASRWGRGGVVSSLVNHSDVQLHAKNTDGETARDVALRLGNDDIASQLARIELVEQILFGDMNTE